MGCSRFALRSKSAKITQNGIHTAGVMIAKAPYPQRQVLFSKKVWPRAGPANVLLINGVVVKARAIDRFLSVEVSLINIPKT